jgi:diacylglycerol kinase (ATP)
MGQPPMHEPTPRRAAFSLVARLRSFGFAFSGVVFMLRTQHNAWLHLVATIAVVTVAAVLRISASDWRWIVVAIFLVWSAEAFNTAVEYVCDVVSPGYNVVVKHTKDVAAGAVLLSAISAACIGLLTFWPYLRRH